MAKDPTRITEGDMVLPALEALALNEAGGLSTSELIPILREELKPSGLDLVISPHRADDYFSEKIRNLKSHNTLEKKGLASYKEGRFYITVAGKDFVNSVAGALKSLAEQGFKKSSVNKSVTPDKKCVFIEEGFEKTVSKSIRERSRKLRDAAIKKYSKPDGKIACHGCGFEGSAVYGDGGKGLIEIHHIRPISSTGESKTDIQEALKNVIPLCPNCHRMVHRKAGEVLDLKDLKKAIVAQI